MNINANNIIDFSSCQNRTATGVGVVYEVIGRESQLAEFSSVPMIDISIQTGYDLFSYFTTPLKYHTIKRATKY